MVEGLSSRSCPITVLSTALLVCARLSCNLGARSIVKIQNWSLEGTEAGLLLPDCRTWMPNQAPLGKKVHQEVYPCAAPLQEVRRRRDEGFATAGWGGGQEGGS